MPSLDAVHRSAGRAVTTLGLVGLGVGAAFTVGRMVGVINGVRYVATQAAAMTFVAGWALISSGTMSVTCLRGVAHRRSLPWAAMALLGWSVASVIEFKQPPSPRSVVPYWMAVAMLVIVVIVLRPPVPSGRASVSAALAASLVAFGAAGVLQLEQYPFSPFRMYSVAQLDPRVVAVPAVMAWEGDSPVDVTGVLGPATMRALVDDEDPDHLISVLDLVADVHERTSGGAITRYQVVDHLWQLVPYPAPPGVDLVTTNVRFTYERP